MDLVSRAREQAMSSLLRFELEATLRSLTCRSLYRGPIGVPVARSPRRGQPVRALHWVASLSQDSGDQLFTFDLRTERAQTLALGFARRARTPVALPASATRESGRVLSLVYDPVSDATELLVVSEDPRGQPSAQMLPPPCMIRTPNRGFWLCCEHD